jgi:hypothetical protein
LLSQVRVKKSQETQILQKAIMNSKQTRQ